MPVITGLAASPRNPGKWVVQLDGAPVAALAIGVIERLGLRTGLALDAAALAALQHEGKISAAMDRALNMLAFRARSSRELRTGLVRKGEEPPVVDEVIRRLTDSGLINDADFARQFSRARVLGPGHSKRRLQQELWKKGVTREVADEAIADVMEDEAVDAGEIIDRVARKKLRTLGSLDPQTRRRRLYAFLARRGYEIDDIRRVLDELSKDEGEEEPGED